VKNIFDLHQDILTDYKSYIDSFINIADEKILNTVTKEFNSGNLYPEPLVQFNPSFESGGNVDDLVKQGVLFKQFAPYFPELVNDTAFVYQYPEKIPTFPLYMLNNAYLSSYRIPAAFTTLGQNINPEFAFRLFPSDGVAAVSGTWVITNRLPFTSKK